MDMSGHTSWKKLRRKTKRKLWLHFLPHRCVCYVLGHRWADPEASFIDGPLHLPPSQRHWQMIAYLSQCDRCAKVKDVPYGKFREDEETEKAILDAEQEWDDPQTRAALEQTK